MEGNFVPKKFIAGEIIEATGDVTNLGFAESWGEGAKHNTYILESHLGDLRGRVRIAAGCSKWVTVWGRKE